MGRNTSGSPRALIVTYPAVQGPMPRSSWSAAAVSVRSLPASSTMVLVADVTASVYVISRSFGSRAEIAKLYWLAVAPVTRMTSSVPKFFKMTLLVLVASSVKMTLPVASRIALLPVTP